MSETITDVKVKRCCGCWEYKPLDSFGIDRKSKDGRNPQCRACRNTITRERYAGIHRVKPPRDTTRYDHCILAAVQQLTHFGQNATTLREITAITGLSYSGVRFALQRIQRIYGYVQITPGESRTIRYTERYGDPAD